MVESASDSFRSSVSSPGIPNTYRTPSASRHSTKTSEALRSLISASYITKPTWTHAAPRRRDMCLSLRMRAAVGLSMVATLALAGTASASGTPARRPHASASSAGGPATTLYITGAGFGHGIGMSQYGAYGYALHGWSYQQILAHYYTGTALGTTNPAQTVRVLLGSGSAAFAGATQAGTGTTQAGAKKLNPSVTYDVV